MARKPLPNAIRHEPQRRRDPSDRRLVALSSSGGAGPTATAVQTGTGGGNYSAMAAGLSDFSPTAAKPAVRVAFDDETPDAEVYGATGTAFFSGRIWHREEYVEEFKTFRQAVDVYDRIRNDAQASAVLQSLTQPILSADWKVEPATPDATDKEIASMVETALFHEVKYQSRQTKRWVVQTWPDVLRHALLMLTYGFSLFEIVWRTEAAEDGGDDWVKLARLLPLQARTVYQWLVDPADNELDAVRQQVYQDQRFVYKDIPAYKLLRLTWQQEGDNFEGRSALRPIFKDWYYKDNLLKIRAIAFERNGMTYPYLFLPQEATAADRDAATELVENMRATENAGGVLPFGADIRYPANHGRHSEFQQAVEYHDFMMASAVLAQFLVNGGRENGTRGMDTSQGRRFLANLQAVPNQMAATISHELITQLVDYNYSGVAVYPRLVCPKLITQDLDMIEAALNVLGPFINPADQTFRRWAFDQFGIPAPTMDPVQNTNPMGGPGGALPPGAAGDAGEGDQGDQQDQGQGQQQYSEDREAALLLAETLSRVEALDAVERGAQHLNGNVEMIADDDDDAILLRGGFGGFHVSGGRVGKGSRIGADFASKHPRDMGGKFEDNPEAAYRAAHERAQERKAERAGRENERETTGERRATRRGLKGIEGEGERVGKAKVGEEESIHERAARLQREGNLPKEAQLGERLVAVHARASRGMGAEGQAEDVRNLAHDFGEHQLGSALSRIPMPELKAMAKAERLPAGGTKAAIISRLTAHVTEGRYSANFGQGESAKATTTAAKAGGAKAGMAEKLGGDEFARIQAGRRIPADQVARRVGDRGVDPFKPIDLHYSRAVMGEQGLRHMLDQMPRSSLVQSARFHGFGAFPKGSSEQQMRDLLYAHITKHSAEESERIAKANMERIYGRRVEPGGEAAKLRSTEVEEAKAAKAEPKPPSEAQRLTNDWQRAQKEYDAPERPTVKSVREWMQREDLSPAAREVGTRQLAKLEQVAATAHQAQVERARQAVLEAARQYQDITERFMNDHALLKEFIDAGRAHDQARKALARLEAKDALAPKAPAKSRTVKSPEQRAAEASAKAERAQARAQTRREADVRRAPRRAPLEVVRQMPEWALDPYAAPNAHLLRAMYGDSHLEAALGRRTLAGLQEAARFHGLDDHGSRATLVKRIAAYARQVPEEQSVAIALGRAEMPKGLIAKTKAAAGAKAANGAKKPLGEADKRHFMTPQPAQQAPAPKGETDEHGQRMPFTRAEFSHALAQAQSDPNRPALEGVNRAEIVTLGGREYIAKAATPDVAYGYAATTPQVVASHEVAARDLANIAGMGDAVPRESFHVSQGGKEYSVQSREPGKAIVALSPAERMAFFDAVRADPRHALFNYLINREDGHDGNVLYDPASGKITHIDAGFDFATARGSKSYNPFTTRGGEYNIVHEALTRGGSIPPEQVTLPHEAIRAFTQRADQIEAAAQRHGLPRNELSGLHDRLDVLRQLEQKQAPTLGDLETLSGGREHDATGFPHSGNTGRVQPSALHPPAGGSWMRPQQRRRGFLARLLGRR